MKSIREALDLLQARHPEAYEAAMIEVRRIEKAAHVVAVEGHGKVGDYPQYHAWSDAMTVLEDVADAMTVLEDVAKDKS